MELFYYLLTKEEGTEYKTWFYDEGNVYLNPWYCPPIGETEKLFYIREKENEPQYQGAVGGYTKGWTKAPKPKFKAGSQEEIDYYITSNKEDMHFIMKESEACTEWYLKNLTEILDAQKENKKIKKSLEL
jgi:hypothetical protein